MKDYQPLLFVTVLWYVGCAGSSAQEPGNGGTDATSGAANNGGATSTGGVGDLGGTGNTGTTLTNNRVTAVSVSSMFTCAVAGESAWCWGYNGIGQLGDNTTVSKFMPVQVSGLAGDISAIDRLCAIVDGGVQCWGGHSNMPKLDVPTVYSTLVQVQGLTAGVTAISGYYLVVDGGLQVMQTSADGTPTAVPVEGLTSGVTAIASGDDGATCVVINGGVQCWGYNFGGDLGNGDSSMTSTTTPVQVVGLSSGATAVAVGEGHTCAIVDGGVQCWGENEAGELGDGTLTNSAVPVQVVGLSSGITAISAGLGQTCAVADGRLFCWGTYLPSATASGDFSTASSSVPVEVTGL